jgi:uncharacterized protein
MAQMKTPGVYIVEKNAFPSSIVEVATAVPAFIGYTEKAENEGKTLLQKPWRITSMAEYHTYFGSAPIPLFEVKNLASTKTDKASKTPLPEGTDQASGKAAKTVPDFSFNGNDYQLNQNDGKFLLYYSLMLFYANGGGACYIVSVGDYTTSSIKPKDLTDGIELLKKEQEPTLVVIPDAVLLSNEDCIAVQVSMLSHCGGDMKNRFSILDIFNGYLDRKDPSGNVIDNFRDELGTNFMDFGAAYYPWVNTVIVQANDLSYQNISNKEDLEALLINDAGLKLPLPDTAPPADQKLADEIGKITNDDLPPIEKVILDKTLTAISKLYKAILREMKNKINLMPPSGAIAGIYTMVDNTRGVWKAPANVSLNYVVSPSVNITSEGQEDLNITLQGKSINAIRSFTGEGTLVWGARTLDGNSQDWRYVNVRRTMIMLEESIKIASKKYVFEPNDSNTWVKMKSMITNFLTDVWKRGGLAGSKPEEAFIVKVGLGETMTPNDILDGILRITVLVAITHPAEFIEITFQQKMQES